MNDKTAQLRDIFMDVADEGTVTETQQEGHGSLATDEGSVDDRLRSVIERLRGKFDLRTELDTDTLCRLVRAFYGGADDEEIANSIVERGTIRTWIRTNELIITNLDPSWILEECRSRGPSGTLNPIIFDGHITILLDSGFDANSTVRGDSEAADRDTGCCGTISVLPNIYFIDF